MISKIFKLKTIDVKLVSKTGKLFKSQYFDIRVVNSPLLNIAVVVSKKIDKRAVVRNRIKRKIYDSVRDLNKENSIKEAKYFLIVRNIEVDKLSISDIKSEILKTIA